METNQLLRATHNVSVLSNQQLACLEDVAHASYMEHTGRTQLTNGTCTAVCMAYMLYTWHTCRIRGTLRETRSFVLPTCQHCPAITPHHHAAESLPVPNLPISHISGSWWEHVSQPKKHKAKSMTLSLVPILIRTQPLSTRRSPSWHPRLNAIHMTTSNVSNVSNSQHEAPCMLPLQAMQG